MSPVKAVLFDRDGTLVHDVPYNGDPERVRPVEGAREAVALLREHGIRTGVVTNQSGIARGLLSDTDVRHVNRRIDDLIGPFDVWAICPHGPDDGCHCRKPEPGLVLWAAGRVCTDPADCVVIGDIGADTEAAERAGAHGILVPNAQTRPQETATANHVAPDLLTAVRAVLAGPPRGRVLVDERPIGAAFDTGTDGSEPAAAVDGRAPAGGADGSEPAAGVDERASAAGVDGSEPAAVVDGRVSAAGVDGSEPVAVVDGRVSAAGVDGSEPATAADRPAPGRGGRGDVGAGGEGGRSAVPGVAAPGARSGRDRSVGFPGRGTSGPEAARTRAVVDTRGRPR